MANFENRTLFENDNLPVLRALDADSVDLIYLDPRLTRIRIMLHR